MFSSVRAARVITRCSKRRRQCLFKQQQFIHTSGPKSATPFPIAEVHSAPPPPPQPSPSTAEERLQRRQRQAELLQSGRDLKPKPGTALQKRFWKHVSVKESPEGWQIYLDARPVRTADKKVLTIPKNKHQLAMGIALEWDLLVTAQQALKQHYIPLTSMVSRAIDIETADLQGDSSVRDSIITMLMRYFNTDTLLCWAPEKDIHGPTRTSKDSEGPSLRTLQMKAATPIISYLTSRVWPGVDIIPVLDPDSILPAPQPAMTQEIIRGWISGLKAYELAGLERAVLASKSLLVAARLLVEWSQEFAPLRVAEAAERFGLEDAAHACSLEVNWQTGMWGEVEDTHDVDKEDVRRQLGGVVLLVNGETS
jgi:ATP synthase F1 complex assembly factor 2